MTPKGRGRTQDGGGAGPLLIRKAPGRPASAPSGSARRPSAPGAVGRAAGSLRPPAARTPGAAAHPQASGAPRRPARPRPASERRPAETGPGGAPSSVPSAPRARGRPAPPRVTHILATSAVGECRRSGGKNPEAGDLGGAAARSR